jgi:putative copper resistance protein D
MSPLDAAAIIARLAQFSGAAVLCGGALFFLYGVKPDAQARWPSRLIGAACALAALGALGWLMAQSAQFSEAPADAFDPAKVWSVAADTGFGRVALARVGLFLIAAVLAAAPGASRRRWITLAALGVAVSASFAWTGHGARDEGLTGIVHLAADVLHMLAASTWIGALAVLAVLAIIAGRPGAEADAGRDTLTGLVRFSSIGVGVVGILVASGLVNSWLLIGPAGLSRVLTTPYGQLLLAKLGLFGAMLGLAAANRYHLTPRLEHALADGGAKAITPVVRSILAETALALLVLALVSWLGTLSPPLDG